MSESTPTLEEFVRKGVAAQDAAAVTAGRLTAWEYDRERQIEELRYRLERELGEAIALTQRAARTLAELMSDSVYDVEFVEGDTGRDAAHFIDDARRTLSAAHGAARSVYAAEACAFPRTDLPGH